jgi:N-acetylated-alpha-linked acidic dipeptidase
MKKEAFGDLLTLKSSINARWTLANRTTTSSPNAITSFHGYSFTGNASAGYVYVGRGQQVDFDKLVALGVPLKGKIALAK